VVPGGQPSLLNDFVFQRHFRLRRRPFVSYPCPDQYFAAASIENARGSLTRMLERYEGPGLVVGPVGTGKSLLMRLIAESFRYHCRVVVLPGGRLGNRRSLLQVILYELGLPYRELEEGELRLSLMDHVGNSELCPSGLLLLVDEAERLPPPLLDELRSMTNLMTGGKTSIRLVLFGSQRLEERFADPRLESFNQRLAGRFYLEAFTQKETRQYVQRQFSGCGGDLAVFPESCLDTIHGATGGIPRLINQLCDHALILAAVDGRSQLSSEQIEEAWADLQQLPVPARRTHASDGATGVIEFGPLDEESAFEDTPPPTEDERTEEPPTDLGESESEVTGNNSDKPQVELVFHPAHNPFAEEFAEEEVVVDQYASADLLARRHQREVSCAESRQIANHLEQLVRQLQTNATPNSDPTPPSSEEQPTQETAREEMPAETAPDGDTVAEETVTEEMLPDENFQEDQVIEEQLTEETTVLEDSPDDSSPAHEDSAEPKTASSDSPCTRHSDYRRLFSRLRQATR
jgi:type II secretory pathway predicted ATPase ExeA